MPTQIKRHALNKLRISAISYQSFSASLLYRYSTIFSSHEYDYIRKIAWNEKPDPLNPDTGWSSRKSTEVFPLTGENVGIVPKNSIGCKMDRACYASTWNNNAYSFTNISSLFQGDSITSKNEFYYASVYCYVSKDFDGSWARISTEGEVSGKNIKEYDLNKKGIWQKLSICFTNKGRISPVYLYWAKNSVIDFSNLKGYIIFAYPECGTIKADPKNPDSGWGLQKSSVVFPLVGEKVDIVPENSMGYEMDSTCYSSTWYNTAHSLTDISSLFQGDSTIAKDEFYYASVYCYVSKDFDGSWARISTEGEVSGKINKEYDLNKKGIWQKLSICFTNKGGISAVNLYWAKNSVTTFSNLKGHIIFAYPEYGTIKVDPKNPDSGWGSQKSTIVFPLTGEKVDIVPENSMGYKMDSTCYSSTWYNNAHSLTDISSLFQGDSTIANYEFYHASVYCYVSKDFDGSWTRISVEGGASGKIVQEYDFRKKGTWQKLQIDFASVSGIPPVYLYWCKDGVIDFKNLKGFVIYAYPEYYKDSTNRKIEISSRNRKKTSLLLSKSSFFDIDLFSSILSRIRFSFLHDSVTRVKKDKYFNDLVRNKFSGSRTSRWYYSWVIFKNYSLRKKLFGGGFEYLEMFKKEFNEINYDYPHNPFLSAFLYSGIIGGFAYFWFMFMVFYYYIKYYKYHVFYFVCFLVTFYFSFFSANTHFSVAIFAIFSIIPFLTRSIVENEEKEKELKAKSQNSIS
jgi:hypothetical protein